MKLSIDEYGPWVSGELDKSLRPTRSKAGKLLEEAARSLSDAQSFYTSLSRKGERDMATKKDAASYRAARVIGHAAQQAEASLKDIQIPIDVTWESLKVLKDGLSGASRSIRNFRDAASRELSGFYLLDQRSFGGALDRIARSGERLSAFLDGEGSTLQRSKTMSSIVDSMATARSELSEKLEESKSLARERDGLHGAIEQLNVRVDELSSDHNLHETLEIERELRKESRSFRTESLAHLQRPLRRLGDLAQRGDYPISTDEREALAVFIKTPYKSFLSNSTGNYVARILEDLRKAIDSGKMEFKPRKTGRISAQLNQLISTGQLSAKQEKGRRLLSRRRELLRNEDCKDKYAHRKILLSKIEETKRRDTELDERSHSMAAMYEALNKRLLDLMRQAEAKTREYLGQDVQLERP